MSLNSRKKRENGCLAAVSYYVIYTYVLSVPLSGGFFYACLRAKNPERVRIMNRPLCILSVFCAVVLGALPGYANTVTYKISVTVPAIVGVNVPAENTPATAAAEAPVQLAQTTETGYWDVTTQDAVRQNEHILLRSITVK